ncbi:MAG: sodium:proton antiporter [Gammaproteobacteria bacterium]|nr:MAG: sodium:proton antiporter [Gammaproteobacteria bacterium]
MRLAALLLLLSPLPALAAGGAGPLDLTASGTGLLALAVFVLAYLLVMSEEFTGLRKSKPILLAAGVIWTLIALAYHGTGDHHVVEQALRASFLEYAELMLFLLVAMTYINTMEDRCVFAALRSWLVQRDFNLRSIFWITGLLGFFISPVADNLTTALLMCAVVLAVGGDDRRYVSLSCISIVVAVNAGGAFSPFGDITTLMVWQKETVHFTEFFHLLLPSLINWLIPAAVMSRFVPRELSQGRAELVGLRRGARRVILLFLLTILTAVAMHQYLDLPPFFGMVTGLGYLQLLSFYLRRSALPDLRQLDGNMEPPPTIDMRRHAFDVFETLSRAEWDTLLFFYGVIMCVGGLGFMGYLDHLSHFIYGGLGATTANVVVGVLSAVIDNIPVMYAVLGMNPDMPLGQWLLVTLTAGVGGSLLSIGSAAGVALMGQARGCYTFFSHLRWMPVIALGYAASILAHLWINQRLF